MIKITSEKAWNKISDTLEKGFIAVPTDFSDVYTEYSQVPKDIKGVILFKHGYYMFLIEFMEDGDVFLTKEDQDPREVTGVMKEFDDNKNLIVAGEYNSSNGEPTLYNEHRYVDLGLPSGLKWATSDAGHFAWAETSEKEYYSKSSARKRTKFADVRGDENMDAARVHFGGKWRLPTPKEFQELIDNCSWQWRGWGYLLTGPNGKQLFLTACGYNNSAWGPLNKMAEGYYWTAISKEGEDIASYLFFNKKERKLDWKESFTGMHVRPVFSDAESEPEPVVEEGGIDRNSEEYNKGIVREGGTLLEKYVFSGERNWRTGKCATAQHKIKDGDVVELKFLGASEGEFYLNSYNPVWETDDHIDVMGENFYFEVVVNDKQSYYGKYAGYRYTEKSVATGPTYLFNPKTDRTSIGEKQVYEAFSAFKNWLSKGAKKNDFWHGLYKKTEFPETIAYGMPGEENVAPVEEKTWSTGDIIDEGEGIFTTGGIRYELFDNGSYVDGQYKKESALRVLPLRGTEKYSGTVTVPESVKYKNRKRTVRKIEFKAFDDCPELKELHLPGTITDLSRINGCQKLEKIEVASDNEYYESIDGVVFTKKQPRWFGHNHALVCYPYAHGEHYAIPKGIEEIVAGAFEGCLMLKSVTLPASLREIGGSAFKDCTNLSDITFGSGLEIIRDNAFENCTALTSIEFPKSLSSVYHNAFLDCTGITSLTFSKGKYFYLKSLPDNLFPWGQPPFIQDGICYYPAHEYNREDEALVMVMNIPEEKSGNNVNSDVETLRIPSVVEHYGFVYEVSKCKASFSQFPSLKRLELPGSVTDISIVGIQTLQEVAVDKENPTYSAADGLLLSKDGKTLLGIPRGYQCKKLVIPEGVEVVGEKVGTELSNIEELVLPDSILKIEKNAFSHCPALHDVHLGENLKKIAPGAFSYTGIERIALPPHACFTKMATYDGDRPFQGSKLRTFELIGEHEMYTVIDGVLYMEASWGLRLRYCPPAFPGRLQLPEGLQDICPLACYKCSELESVYIPDGVRYIEDNAFAGCPKLTEVEFDGHVGNIGSWCFSGCSSLKELDCIGAREIEDTAFSGLKDLKLNLPYSLESKRYKFEEFMKR